MTRAKRLFLARRKEEKATQIALIEAIDKASEMIFKATAMPRLVLLLPDALLIGREGGTFIDWDVPT